MLHTRKLMTRIFLCAVILLMLPSLSVATIIDNIQSKIETDSSGSYPGDIWFYGGTYEVNSDGTETEKNFSKYLTVESNNGIGDGVVITVQGNGTADSAKMSATRSLFANSDGSDVTLNVTDGGLYEGGSAIQIARGELSTSTINVTNGGRVTSDSSMNVAFSSYGRSNGTANVDGPGSSITVGNGWFAMGSKNGNAAVNVTNGGLIKVGQDDDDPSSASMQIGGIGSATTSVTVQGRAVQVKTSFEKLDDLMQLEDPTPAFDFYNNLSLGYEEGQVFDSLNQKYAEFIGRLEYEEYQALKSGGTLSTAFFGSLDETDQNLLSSNDKFGTKTESRSSLIIDDSLQNGKPALEDNNDASTTIIISDHGLVESDRVIWDGDQGKSVIVVSDNGELRTGSILLGATTANSGYEPGKESAILSVSGTGVVKADRGITIQPAGILKGDGTIIGDVYVNGGTVAPGNSPGTLTIDGNFTLKTGILELEIDGPNLFDIIEATGSINIYDSANIVFWLNDTTIDSINILDFFKAGQLFGVNFFDNFNPLDNISFMGLTGDEKIDLDFLDTAYVFTEDGGFLKDTGSGNGGADAIPEPGTMVLFCLGLIGLTGVSRKKS